MFPAVEFGDVPDVEIHGEVFEGEADQFVREAPVPVADGIEDTGDCAFFISTAISPSISGDFPLPFIDPMIALRFASITSWADSLRMRYFSPVIGPVISRRAASFKLRTLIFVQVLPGARPDLGRTPVACVVRRWAECSSLPFETSAAPVRDRPSGRARHPRILC